jgi:hypothetical protein
LKREVKERSSKVKSKRVREGVKEEVRKGRGLRVLEREREVRGKKGG